MSERLVGKAFWLESVRVSPRALGVIRSIEVQNHSLARFEAVTVVFKFGLHPRGDGGEERIVSTDLLDEPGPRLGLPETPQQVGMFVYGMGGEHPVARDGHGGSEQVQSFHRSHIAAKLGPARISVKRYLSQRVLFGPGQAPPTHICDDGGEPPLAAAAGSDTPEMLPAH